MNITDYIDRENDVIHDEGSINIEMPKAPVHLKVANTDVPKPSTVPVRVNPTKSSTTKPRTTSATRAPTTTWTTSTTKSIISKIEKQLQKGVTRRKAIKKVAEISTINYFMILLVIIVLIVIIIGIVKLKC